MDNYVFLQLYVCKPGFEDPKYREHSLGLNKINIVETEAYVQDNAGQRVISIPPTCFNPQSLLRPTSFSPKHQTTRITSILAIPQRKTMAPQKAYPRSVMKRIVKAHSDHGLSKNVDVLIYLDYALFLQESVPSPSFQKLLRRLTHRTDSFVNLRSRHKPSSLRTARVHQQRARNPVLRPGTSERFPRSVVLRIRLHITVNFAS